MADYKERIRKLLALAKSPEEAEAKAALLRARELMAKHKLTEADLEEAKKQAVKNVLTDITFSKRRDPWIASLSAVIGESYCCKGFRTHRPYEQTQIIGFIGLEDDVEICTAVFKYAVDCIRAGAKEIRKENVGCDPQYIMQQCDSFGYGFSYGIQKALKGQDKEQGEGWGLVLVMPQEVQEAAKDLRKQPFRAKTEERIDQKAYSQGYAQGKEFDPAHRLGGGMRT